MGTLGQDVRYGIRRMKRSPGFTAAAVATLALGLGLNSAVSSLAHALFLKGLPLDESERLALVDQTLAGRPAQLTYSLSYPDYLYLPRARGAVRGSRRALSHVAHARGHQRVHVRGARERGDGELLQRAATPAWPGPILRRGGGSGTGKGSCPHYQPRSLAAQIQRGPDHPRHRHARERRRFPHHRRCANRFPRHRARRSAVRRLHSHGDVQDRLPLLRRIWRDCKIVNLIGRLQAGISIRDAQAEMSVLASQLETRFPDANRGRGVLVRPARGVRAEEQQKNAPIVALLAAAAALVLLVASANVAGLLLARGLRRRKEIAIRLALGASRGRLIRQLLVESILLATCGGAAGLIVAIWATEMLRGFFGIGSTGIALNLDLCSIPASSSSRSSSPSLPACLPGSPALQSTKRDALPALKDETAGLSARRSRLRDGLMVCQVAMSVLLLASSALLVQSFVRLHRGPGFDPDTVVLLG